MDRTVRVEADITPLKQSLARSALLHFRADDSHLVTDADGQVVLWPNRAGLPSDARRANSGVGPSKLNVAINGHTKTVLRFDGRSWLEAPRRVPSIGTVFLVYQTAKMGKPGQRLLGWEGLERRSAWVRPYARSRWFIACHIAV